MGEGGILVCSWQVEPGPRCRVVSLALEGVLDEFGLVVLLGYCDPGSVYAALVCLGPVRRRYRSLPGSSPGLARGM